MSQLFERAAAPTLARIRNDRERAPVQVRPLLEHVETHLFDPDLDGKRLKQACGVRDNHLPVQFHAAMSLPPYAYIVDCRMEVACRLLKDTDLKVWQIAQQLGYSNLAVFSRAFDRWAGVRPSVFRRRSRVSSSSSPASTDASTLDMPTRVEALPWLKPEIIVRGILGRLERSEADRLVSHLFELYPESFERLQFAPNQWSSFTTVKEERC